MTNSDLTSEASRRAALVAAEKRAEKLFEEIEQRALLQPGRDESEIEKEIYSIALQEFSIEKHWHKRIVRSGPNTLTIAADNPPVRTIETNDIVYVDLGPVFEDWEADLGRTYVLGDHPGAPWSPICRSFLSGSSHTTMHRPISRGLNSTPSPKSRPRMPDGFSAA